MKFSIFDLLSKVTDLILKKSKNGEKDQDIKKTKINTFNECLERVTYIFVILVVLNSIFPKLQLSDWNFNMLEKLLNYMMP
ncbi:MAG: hypothetical protein ACRCXY_01590 [Fusobacteriaceae bacterium]